MTRRRKAEIPGCNKGQLVSSERPDDVANPAKGRLGKPRRIPHERWGVESEQALLCSVEQVGDSLQAVFELNAYLTLDGKDYEVGCWVPAPMRAVEAP